MDALSLATSGALGLVVHLALSRRLIQRRTVEPIHKEQISTSVDKPLPDSLPDHHPREKKDTHSSPLHPSLTVNAIQTSHSATTLKLRMVPMILNAPLPSSVAN